jgi:hypothetical protein
MAKRITLFYRLVLIMAGPATLWTAFEMYGLTLTGPQMLFFSISHAHPFILTTVFVSSLFFIGLVGMNMLFLLPKPKRHVRLSSRTIAVILAIQLLHILALLSYEEWSAVNAIRIAVCFLGLFLIGGGISFGVLKVFMSNSLLIRARTGNAHNG